MLCSVAPSPLVFIDNGVSNGMHYTFTGDTKARVRSGHHVHVFSLIEAVQEVPLCLGARRQIYQLLILSYFTISGALVHKSFKWNDTIASFVSLFFFSSQQVFNVNRTCKFRPKLNLNKFKLGF